MGDRWRCAGTRDTRACTPARGRESRECVSETHHAMMIANEILRRVVNCTIPVDIRDDANDNTASTECKGDRTEYSTAFIHMKRWVKRQPKGS